jgi:hypothetical protein
VPDLLGEDGRPLLRVRNSLSWVALEKQSLFEHLQPEGPEAAGGIAIWEVPPDEDLPREMEVD